MLATARGRSPAPLRTDSTTLTCGAVMLFALGVWARRSREPLCRLAQRRCRRSRPHLPGRPSRTPQLLQQQLVAQGIHCLPVSGVPVGAQFPIPRQSLQGLRFPRRKVTLDAVERTRIQDKKTAVDEIVVAGGFL